MKAGRMTEKVSRDETLSHQLFFFQDATAIKKTIHTKKAEIDHVLMGAKSSKRLK